MKTFLLRIYFPVVLLFLPIFTALELTSHGANPPTLYLTWYTSYGSVTGYRIYSRTEQEEYDYDNPLDEVDNSTTRYTLQNLEEGVTYHFVVRTYNDYGESEDSNEVCMHFISIQNFYIDNDCDAIPENEDNCPLLPNSPNLGTCVKTENDVISSYRVGKPESFITCTGDADCEATGGTCQLEQGDCNANGCGDVCECYANYNYPTDLKVTGIDLNALKQEYGRFDCSEGNPCCADGNEDGKVTGADLILFKNEYGRLDCPACP